MIIVCAGGVFLFKSTNVVKPVAEEFRKFGFNAAVLDYRFYPYSLDTLKEDGLRINSFLKIPY